MLRLTLLLLFALLSSTVAFAIEKGGIPGIWKLFISENALPSQDSIRTKLLKAFTIGKKKEDETKDDVILLKLNPDGSFRQCSEDYQEGLWISGRWNLQNDRDDQQFSLALDRQYFGPRYDLLLQGKANETLSSKQIRGNVYTGKFMYPKQHPAFFEEPLVDKNLTGTFSMEQAVATESILPATKRSKVQKKEQQAATSEKGCRFKASDFYGRRFYLTIAPLKQRLRETTKITASSATSNQPVDIRAMPIQFFANNTFAAYATNKILRGRFGIRSEDDDKQLQQLWFQVSLFGAGRSAPGSVYSEGLGLTHEDKRTYVGEIVTDHDRLFVSGTVTFGSDLGSDARPEPVAIFELFETSSNYDSETTAMVDEDERNDNPLGSVFE